jgi:hypothetical protein
LKAELGGFATVLLEDCNNLFIWGYGFHWYIDLYVDSFVKASPSALRGGLRQCGTG